MKKNGKFVNFLFLSIYLMMLFVLSCKRENLQNSYQKFDANKEIKITGFTPDSAGIATPMLIYGDNFGSDTTGLSVYFVDTLGNKTKAGLVSSTGTHIYAYVPKGLSFKRTFKLQVARKVGEQEYIGNAPDDYPFLYKTQTAVTTVVGKQNKNNQPMVGGELLTATLSAPSFLVLDDEENILIVERTLGLGITSHNERGNSLGGNTNIVLASLSSNTVTNLQYNIRPSNAPTFYEDKGKKVVFVPADDGKGVFIMDKLASYVPKYKEFKLTEATKDIINKNWKYSFVVGPDKKIYTAMYRGQLLRIDPNDYTIEVLLEKVSDYKKGSGSDAYLAFSTINPNRLFFSLAHAHQIWYVDIDKINEEKSSTSDFHGHFYAGSKDAEKGWEDGALINAKFDTPRQIAFTDDGKLYIADSKNHCIRVIDTKTDADKAVVNTAIGLPGNGGYADGGPDIAKFKFPSGVAVSKDGKVLYVADHGNKVIRKLEIQ